MPLIIESLRRTGAMIDGIMTIIAKAELFTKEELTDMCETLRYLHAQGGYTEEECNFLWSAHELLESVRVERKE